MEEKLDYTFQLYGSLMIDEILSLGLFFQTLTKMDLSTNLKLMSWRR